MATPAGSDQGPTILPGFRMPRGSNSWSSSPRERAGHGSAESDARSTGVRGQASFPPCRELIVLAHFQCDPMQFVRQPARAWRCRRYARWVRGHWRRSTCPHCHINAQGRGKYRVASRFTFTRSINDDEVNRRHADLSSTNGNGRGPCHGSKAVRTRRSPELPTAIQLRPWPRSTKQPSPGFQCDRPTSARHQLRAIRRVRFQTRQIEAAFRPGDGSQHAAASREEGRG